MKPEHHSRKRLLFWGLAIALMTAVFLSPWASSLPDGLERVAEHLGFVEKAGQSGPIAWGKAPLPDYKIPGIENEGWSRGLSGLLGTLVIAGLGWGLSRLIKRKGI